MFFYMNLLIFIYEHVFFYFRSRNYSSEQMFLLCLSTCDSIGSREDYTFYINQGSGNSEMGYELILINIILFSLLCSFW